MLSSISWQEFIITICCVAAAYYVVAIIVFYRKEIAQLLKQGSLSVTSRNTHTDNNASAKKATPSKPSSLMGTAGEKIDRSLPHTSSESSEELSYAPIDELPDPITEAGSEDENSSQVPVGMISDLLEEIKAICGAITDSVATKDEATALFEALLSRYQVLKDTPYRTSINDHIESMTREPFIANFSREEIEAFWNSER